MGHYYSEVREDEEEERRKKIKQKELERIEKSLKEKGLAETLYQIKWG